MAPTGTCNGELYRTPCPNTALRGSVFCAECDRADRADRAAYATGQSDRSAANAAQFRAAAGGADVETAYDRALAAALLSGRRTPTMAAVAAMRLALHDELVARMATERDDLAYGVEAAATMDAWAAAHPAPRWLRDGEALDAESF